MPQYSLEERHNFHAAMYEGMFLFAFDMWSAWLFLHQRMSQTQHCMVHDSYSSRPNGDKLLLVCVHRD